MTRSGGATTGAGDAEREWHFRLEQVWESGWSCEAGCGARSELEVDHIESRAQSPGRELDPTNAAVACARCHWLKTNGLVGWRRRPDGTLEVRRPERWNQPPERSS